MILRRKSQADGRSVYFDLTDKGHAALADDPLGDLIVVIDGLRTAERATFLSVLSRLTGSLAESRGAHAFGTCGDCAHFTSGDDGGHCAYIPADIAANEIDQLCASHSGLGVDGGIFNGRS